MISTLTVSAQAVDFLPPKERTEALREIWRVLETQAKAAGVPVPDWVEELNE